MDWFLYDNGLHRARVKNNFHEYVFNPILTLGRIII